MQKQAEEIGIDVENLLSLYRLFVEQTEIDIIAMERFISEKDSQAMEASSHHIKGASLNLELYSLVECAKSLHTFAEGEEWEQITLEMENFRGFLNELKSQIQKAENEG